MTQTQRDRALEALWRELRELAALAQHPDVAAAHAARPQLEPEVLRER
jgi:hypothetical protein